MAIQPAILAPLAPAGHVVTVRMTSPQQGKPLLRLLSGLAVGEGLVVGIGAHFIQAIGASIPGLSPFPVFSTAEGPLPATQADVWFWLRGESPAEVFARVHGLVKALPGGLTFVEDQAVFSHSGHGCGHGVAVEAEDPSVAEGPLAGSSFVAAQRWIHERPGHLEQEPADGLTVRTLGHGSAKDHGVYEAAFTPDLARFEQHMLRMVGGDGSEVSSRLQVMRPLTGGYYWCPALVEDRLDLRPILPGGVDALPDIAVEGA